jgi:hypothetical protein
MGLPIYTDLWSEGLADDKTDFPRARGVRS